MKLLGYTIIFTSEIEGIRIGYREIYVYFSNRHIGIKYNLNGRQIRCHRLSFKNLKYFRY